jgi:hypothetical protein
MATKIGSLIDKLKSNPKKLFLIDGSGALLTVFFLIAILVPFEDSFGMPAGVVYFLSLVASMYAIYSFSCYFFIRSNWRPYLKVITIANIIYCCLTIAQVFYFYQSLTVAGLFYFLLEIIVLCVLIFIELMVLFKI